MIELPSESAPKFQVKGLKIRCAHIPNGSRRKRMDMSPYECVNYGRTSVIERPQASEPLSSISYSIHPHTHVAHNDSQRLKLPKKLNNGE